MPRRRNPVRTLFKVETLTSNSIIIIKAGSVMDNDKNRKLLANRIVQMGLKDILFLRLPSLDDLTILNEQQMNKLGWYMQAKDAPAPVKETAHEP